MQAEVEWYRARCIFTRKSFCGRTGDDENRIIRLLTVNVSPRRGLKSIYYTRMLNLTHLTKSSYFGIKKKKLVLITRSVKCVFYNYYYLNIIFTEEIIDGL